MVSISMAYIKGFCDPSVLKVIVVQVANATLLGYVIGFVGVYSTLVSMNEDCDALTTQRACESVSFASCGWDASRDICIFTDADCKVLDEATCRDHGGKCSYDTDDNECKHDTGYGPVNTGLFAGAMPLGGMIGSMGAGYVLSTIGRKKALIIAAVINIIGSVFVHISRGADAFALLVVARVIVGVGTGITCVGSPMYTEEMAPADYVKPVGTMFQVFITFGICGAAAMGLIVEPHDMARKQNNEVRIQMFVMIQTLLSLFALAVSVLSPESTHWLAIVEQQKADSSPSTAPDADGDGEEQKKVLTPTSSSANGDSPNDESITSSPFGDSVVLAERHYSWISMTWPLIIAFFLCLAHQMTGINAIMNFAPTITKSMGLTPLLGNFVIMVWNFVTTLISIPTSSRFSMRQMYVTGTLIATGATLMTGLPTYPGVYNNEGGADAVAAVGIFLFILAFEVGMGPAFYVLAQELFPVSFRPNGASFTMAVQYVFNIVITVCFPIAVEELSGGKNGNQDKGMAIVFFFFTGCGAVAIPLLFFFLYPYEEELEAPELTAVSSNNADEPASATEEGATPSAAEEDAVVAEEEAPVADAFVADETH